MERRGRRRARFIHLGRGAEENENGGHRFFFFAPFSSPSLHLLLFIRPLFFFFSLPLCPLLFFRAQYDAITGKNGKTFPPAPAVSIITVFPACRPQVIVRDPLSPRSSTLFFSGLPRNEALSPRARTILEFNLHFQRMEQRKFVADDHCVRAVDYNRIYGYNNERVRNFWNVFFLFFLLKE